MTHWVVAMATSPMQIRILSVEDHPVFREGLRSILTSQPDMVLVAQATNAVEAVAEFRRYRPDVTLMDLRLPGADGTRRTDRHSREIPSGSHYHPVDSRYRRRNQAGDEGRSFGVHL